MEGAKAKNAGRVCNNQEFKKQLFETLKCCFYSICGQASVLSQIMRLQVELNFPNESEARMSAVGLYGMSMLTSL